MSADGNTFGLEQWRSFARPFFDVIPTGDPENFRASVESRKLGSLIVSEVRFGAAIFDRNPRELGEFDTEFLLLETYDEGTNSGRGGDLVTGLQTREVHVFDMARPWRSQTTTAACRSVVIPYDLIGYDPSRHPAYAHLEGSSHRNTMVLAAMGALLDAGADIEPADAEACAESFADLVRRLMFNQRDREAEERQSDGHGLFLRRFIDEHLSEPELGPLGLCDALGVSRTALYRMFPEEGGVRGYITGCRLDRCFDELRQGRPKRGAVRNVAERWGFFDPKSFNRAFRNRFGITPSDCMNAPLSGAATRETVHAVQDWLRKP